MRPRVFVVSTVALILSGTLAGNGVVPSRANVLGRAQRPASPAPANSGWSHHKKGIGRTDSDESASANGDLSTGDYIVPVLHLPLYADFALDIELHPDFDLDFDVVAGTDFRDAAIPVPAPAPAPPPTPDCTGSPLTSQSQVRSNTRTAAATPPAASSSLTTTRGSDGEVSGLLQGQQQGAVECGNPCHLYNMYIHDNPNAFAGIYSGGPGTSRGRWSSVAGG